MRSEAVFENIGNRIITEIETAQQTLHIAVAWFTNRNIFNTILDKARNGIIVYLIVSDDLINANSKIFYNEIEKYGGSFYKIGNSDTELMHNKFCIIDHSIVITGSYNWSYKAENNLENIIINEDKILAEQFIHEFSNIIRKITNTTTERNKEIPIGLIIKRFQIIKNYIELEEFGELKKEIFKLEEYKNDIYISKIYNAIIKNDYIKIISEIDNFTRKYQSIVLYDDPEISNLKLEVRILENKLNAYDNEKIDLDKNISDFHHSYSLELGNIILEILRLRKIKYQNDKEKQKDAENDFNDFNKDFETEKDKKIFELNEEEKILLKSKFRKASFLCHPDKVNDELKDIAQKIFIELKIANDANDLKKVTEILNDLETGNLFKHKSATIIEIDRLMAYISKLKIQILQLEDEINKIKASETYQLIVSILDWTEYFSIMRTKLNKEMSDLQMELENKKYSK
ncbi:MAG: phospholipase D-like domain-containing protein [Bacteroidetes bacterium]|nr:phospholipase D-like domain-containing protein [Bacteroidota bacterium]